MSKRPQPSRPKDTRPPKDRPTFPKKPQKKTYAEEVADTFPLPTREDCVRLMTILGPHLPAEQQAA